MADYPMSAGSSSKKRKRSGSFSKGSRSGPLMRNGSFYSQPKSKKMYVSRTPGGNLVADNHYFDTERSLTSVSALDTGWSAAALDPDTTAMLCLFAPVIGDDISNRSGRKTFIKKIRITGRITCAAQTAQAAGDAPFVIRMVVFEDAQTNATQATGDLVLAQGNATNAIAMGMSTVNFGRFRILKEKTMTFKSEPLAGLTGAFVNSGVNRPFKFSIKVNKYVNFNAQNGGTVADIVDNSYHFIALCTNNAMAPQLQYKVRTVFLP